MTMAVLAGASNSGNLFAATSYTGNGATQSIITGQNLAGGSLVWGKNVGGGGDWACYDTVRGNTKRLIPNATNAEITDGGDKLVSFNSNGVTYGANSNENTSGVACLTLSWLEQAGFMDVVTYTGDGTTPRNISHALAATPKLILVKCRSAASGWVVGHESATWTKWGALQSTVAFENATSEWNNTAPTSSVITLGNSSDVNGNGSTYVAYLFAEKAGKSKFGTQSGTTTINTGLPSIKTVLKKRSDGVGDWYLFYEDGGTWYHVKPNSSDARATGLITVVGGDITFSGAASTGTGIYAAWG